MGCSGISRCQAPASILSMSKSWRRAQHLQGYLQQGLRRRLGPTVSAGRLGLLEFSKSASKAFRAMCTAFPNSRMQCRELTTCRILRLTIVTLCSRNSHLHRSEGCVWDGAVGPVLTFLDLQHRFSNDSSLTCHS